MSFPLNTIKSLLLRTISFRRFHSINTIRATSDPNPHAVVFDSFGDTQTNDNFDPAQGKDNPSICTKKKPLSINQQTTDTVKGTSPKCNKHKADQPKSTRDERRKRDRAEAFANTMVFLGSDSEDKIEVMPTLPGNSQPKYSTDSINTTDSEVECRRKPNKRPRITKENTVSLSMTARTNVPEGSGKASDNEPKHRRKSNTRRVKAREFKGHFDAEVM
ncbi:hypothetical protein DL95DRAFT_477736 [Leptodontidium sp. 2 PMI_412]|nr:hypothetical protein DL95DRAFT_477736 [Leptodontidium sp. 2 PMI_412]